MKKLLLLSIILISLTGCYQKTAWKKVCDREMVRHIQNDCTEVEISTENPLLMNPGDIIYPAYSTSTFFMNCTITQEVIESNCRLVPNHDDWELWENK